ncbi:Zn(2)-C6 fungal-type domain-containing protein [Mycena indigotica]|uniref:Zn(2)-C6 fungal-type domain-containing protein n=1 Tax=Mycena indigotica TaxID=2126181 RepID=A0A8H6WET4_9AGAR|nr:Zn(2)-C6 fungal-type domain-containing protein [Mycena indigotica]KAF7316034.1 Zn(2)-C6 fungal-type domain-containing protein [Mycena indigotica]
MADGSQTIRMSQEGSLSAKLANLEKGKACLNCRRRKVKCDGRRPICTPCSKFLRGGLHDCEYTDTGPTQAQVLEEKISILESRIQEMESPFQAGSSVGLHNPYYPGQGHSTHPSLEGTRPRTPGVIFSNPTMPAERSGPESIALARTLILSFGANSSSFGLFFLDPRLFDPLFQEHGSHRSQGPSAALLDTVCLWGAHLQPNIEPETAMHESRFLAAALHSVSTGLTNAYTPGAILQVLQAHILLAAYLFRVGRAVEGRYHAGVAVSIVMAAGLWRIRSGRNLSMAVGNVSSSLNPLDELTPAVTGLEEGQRIDAFWSVVVLNAIWCQDPGIALAPPSLEYGIVDTPWPLEKEQYSGDARALPEQSARTIAKFIGDSDQTNHPQSTNVSALFAKAAIIYEQAVRKQGNLQVLNQVLEKITRIVERVDVNPRTLLLHSLVHAGSIALHAQSSRTKSMAAASAIVRLVRTAGVTGYRDACLGTIWSSACDIFLLALPSDPRNRAWHEGVEALLSALEALKRQGCTLATLESLKTRYAVIVQTHRRRGG